MKAINLLKWLVDENIDTEAAMTVKIDEEFDFKLYFGYEPAYPIPVGEYLVVYSDCVDDTDLEKLAKRFPDESIPYCIATDNEDKRNGGVQCILLFVLED